MLQYYIKQFMLKFFCLLVMLTAASVSQAQKTFHDIRIGDTLPDIEIRHMLNYPKSSARLSSFQNKKVILDFWATWCSPCIAAFPKLDSIQKRFEKNLQIISVSSEGRLVVENFLHRYSKIKQIRPLVAAQDTVLSLYLRHTYLPHYVWIDEYRKVVAITDESGISMQNVDAFLKGKGFSFVIKRDDPVYEPIKTSGKIFGTAVTVSDADGKKQKLELSSDRFVYQSTLTRFIKGLVPGTAFQDSTYVSLKNMTILALYKTALLGNSLRMVNNHNIVVDILDTALYKSVTSKIPGSNSSLQGRDAELWRAENGYCYELKVSPILAKHRFSIMLQELNLYFGSLYNIAGSIENRETEYLALVKTGDTRLLRTRKTEPKAETDQKLFLELRNVRIDALPALLAVPLSAEPQIINETDINENIDLQLNCQLSNLAAINEGLSKYGIQLIRKEKMLDVAVIKMKQ